MPTSHKLIYAVYCLFWILMAVNPKYPQDWLLENVLVLIFFPFVVWMDAKHHYTLLSIVFLLLFTSLHSLGAHYTYAEMEHFDAITQWFGFERNHFDRMVHFLFGLLVFRVLFEMTQGLTRTPKASLFFTFSIIVMISTLYELLEWFAAVLLHPELGMAFLGTQGDIWDAHKDTVLATMGALVNVVFYRQYVRLWIARNTD